MNWFLTGLLRPTHNKKHVGNKLHAISLMPNLIGGGVFGAVFVYIWKNSIAFAILGALIGMIVVWIADRIWDASTWHIYKKMGYTEADINDPEHAAMKDHESYLNKSPKR